MSSLKSFQDLTLSDSYMFSCVMSNTEVAQPIIQEIYGRSVDSIVNVVAGDLSEGSCDIRSTRFEVNFADHLTREVICFKLHNDEMGPYNPTCEISVL